MLPRSNHCQTDLVWGPKINKENEQQSKCATICFIPDMNAFVPNSITTRYRCRQFSEGGGKYPVKSHFRNEDFILDQFGNEINCGSHIKCPNRGGGVVAGNSSRKPLPLRQRAPRPHWNGLIPCIGIQIRFMQNRKRSCEFRVFWICNLFRMVRGTVFTIGFFTQRIPAIKPFDVSAWSVAIGMRSNARFGISHFRLRCETVREYFAAASGACVLA